MDTKYVRTLHRVHRVLVADGRPFQMERCNLDDAKLGQLLDEPPAGLRCKWCWVGEPAAQRATAPNA